MYIYWKEERHRETDRHFLTAGSLLKCLKQPGLGQDETNTLELTPALLLGWQAHTHLHIPYFLPGNWQETESEGKDI